MDKSIKEKLDFNKTKDKLISFLEDKDNSIMVFATSAVNKVMTRTILQINNELDIYFFTWKYSRKCKQIEINNNISLCKGKIEIEGEAKILGLMTSKENEKILEIFRKKHPDSIKKWESKPNMIIIQIKPIFACIDGYSIDNDAYLEYIDLEKQESYRLKWAYH